MALRNKEIQEMSNKQQTAVEWLFETVCNNDWKYLPGEIKLQIFDIGI